MGLQRLKTDEEFKHLIRPLLRKEYLQLEQNLLADGCRDPIVVWHDVIVDGHNRYEICMRHGIPFDTKDMEFECREAAIAWICANQLGRRNITEETRKFLSLIAVSGKNKETMLLIKYAEEILDWLSSTYKEKESFIREALETKVNNIFEQMYHGHRRVSIDQKYQVMMLPSRKQGDSQTRRLKWTRRA